MLLPPIENLVVALDLFAVFRQLIRYDLVLGRLHHHMAGAYIETVVLPGSTELRKDVRVQKLQ